jgi:3-hydroxymyristoyl/3-hydroxydecanoyl-(acyl carrier protein) dehydratase
MNEYRASAKVAPDHPCLAGHFPGNPIVPGVVMLELVAAALRDWRGTQTWIAKFNSVKFVNVLRPDETVEITLQGRSAQLRFSCVCGDRLLSQGSFELAS